MAGNSNSGRRPKPTALHVLRGNPSKKNLDVEEPVPSGPVEKPTDLSSGASAVWDRVAPICLGMGTLTAGDVESFAAFCELSAVLKACAKVKRRRSYRLFVGHNLREHPAIRLERTTAIAIRPYFEYFGLTPSARAKLATPKRERPSTSKWAAMGLR